MAASVAGAEKFHSGMVPHAGTDTRVWREISELGADLAGLAELEGSRVDARVAIVFEWDSWRSLEQEAVPTRLSYVEHVFAWYAPLFERNVVTDFVRADADLSGYDTVIVPSLFCATPAALDNLAAYADGGGHLVVTFQTGIVDEAMHITSGGYLGSLQATLGATTQAYAAGAAFTGKMPSRRVHHASSRCTSRRSSGSSSRSNQVLADNHALLRQEGCGKAMRRGCSAACELLAPAPHDLRSCELLPVTQVPALGVAADQQHQLELRHEREQARVPGAGALAPRRQVAAGRVVARESRTPWARWRSGAGRRTPVELPRARLSAGRRRDR